MRKIFLLIALLTLLKHLSFGQTNAALFDRLQGISNNGVDYFNVDGIEITAQKKAIAFNAKSIARNFKQLKIKEKELVESDSLLGVPNFYVLKSEERPKGVAGNAAYYFIENKEAEVIAISFFYMKKRDAAFERNFIKLVKNNEIPETVFNSLVIDSINFAGRKIQLGSSCHWMGINNIQCKYYGQMNWSVHRDLEDAKQAVEGQFLSISSGNKGKIVADTTIPIIFEGTETTARKIIYDFTGVTSVLVGMSGGKTLTIYFVSAPVRNNFISCVMSFWNNDQINPSGLAPLLELVMTLKE